MFSSPTMLEAQNGEIHMQDAKYDSVRAMVEFMYTGATESLDQGNIDEILAIADKYEVLMLKDQCERLIAQTINLKNVTQVAMFSDTYTADYLKSAVIRFLMTHHRVVIKTQDWINLKKSRHELANELLEAVLTTDQDDDDTSMSASQVSSPPSRKRVRRSAK
ncbi:Protein CBR-BATH-42 [Caenorhabditis briggsae]|nr:Protein CBR-BATH-42 [Caenorhabditis briggsae]CAP34582.2 Protein CBR-BATH-42 [Caenorhabditis briggsae]